MTVVLGVTGGIAAYKAADLVSRLKKRGVDCRVIMTENASQFVAPLTFESISGNPVACDMFEAKARWEIEHISLAKRADVFVIAPATANIIAKLAHGIADDMLSTTVLASKAPLIVAPAMNTVMYESAAVQHNIEILRSRGAVIIEPEVGLLACNDVGRGKLASVELIEDIICFELSRLGEDRDLFAGKKVLVTAGPTVEPLDPVRYITNRSSGKMGYAFAEVAARMGAQVVLVTGPTSIRAPYGVRTVRIRTAKELLAACEEHSDSDYIIMAAAPADFASSEVSREKLKVKSHKSGEGAQGGFELRFVLNPDIIATVGRRKREGQIIVAFAAETENLIENAVRKLADKNADYIVANDVSAAGAGFDVDTNIASLISISGERTDFSLMPKLELAEKVLKIIAKKE